MTSFVSREDLKRLDAGILDVRGRALCLLLFETGCTTKEALSLARTDVALKKRMVRIGSFRTISAHLASLLSACLVTPSQRLVFSTRARALTERRVQQLLLSYGRNILQKKLTPHMFRSGYIVNQFLNNTPLQQIEQQLGLQSVQRYLYAYFNTLTLPSQTSGMTLGTKRRAHDT